jgi:hypothetical protein
MMVKHIGFQVEILMAWRVHTPMWIGPRVGELSPSSDHQKKSDNAGKNLGILKLCGWLNMGFVLNILIILYWVCRKPTIRILNGFICNGGLEICVMINQP